MNFPKYILVLIAVLFIMPSCARKVTRIDEQQVIDLSGKWNNTDNQIVSEEMINSFLDGTWIDEHKSRYGTDPVIIVGFVVNKSHEHIESEAFIKDLEKNIVAHNNLRLVQGGAKRDAIRSERADQQTNASNSTMKQFGLESGADYMIQGSITSTVDAYKKRRLVEYEVSLEATHIQTNEIVWIDSKKVTKFIQN